MIVGAGAKILGPFTVGAGAKIGSNAVVTREVPPGATAVGIPGRVIVKSSDEQEAKRKAIGVKIGFDAYGVSEHMPDALGGRSRSCSAMRGPSLRRLQVGPHIPSV